MSKIYLVDSENIGASWSVLLPSMSPEDMMFIFYTEKSPYISYDNLLQVIAHCEIPVFIKCYEGKNALDFQLVSELGFKLCQNPDAEFIIVSDDYGYDPAVRYWKERKYNVHRIGKKNCKPLPVKKQEETVIHHVAEEIAGESVTEVSEQIVMNQEPEVFAKPIVVEAAEPVSIQKEETVNKSELIDQTEESKSEEIKPEEEKVQEDENQTEDETVNLTVSDDQTQAEQTDVQQASLKENQTPKKLKERRKKHKKETAKEPEAVVETSLQEKEENLVQMEKTDTTQPKQENALDLMLLDIVTKCESPDPMKDAFSVREMFYSISMSNLTEVNTALKILIGNEVGNNIYRVLKEHQDCRVLLDELYLPDTKRRFMKYVQTVLERNTIEGISTKEMGDFLLGIPRKNLNSIRSAMIKEYGHDQGSLIYTIFKPHIKVLNNI